MGGIIACLCCYCCLTTLRPRCIEIIALIFNLIGIGCMVWGIVDIPWEVVKKGGKALFYISGALMILTLLILLVLMCLRCGNKINTTKNSSGKCLCITSIVFALIAEILIIIAEIIIVNNMNDKDDDYWYDDYYYNYRRRRRDTVFSDREWAAVFVSTTGAEICLAIYCYCLSFLLKLIYAKTNKSYLKYHESKEDNNIVTRTIHAFDNSQTIPDNNQLNFIGYDKDGHPIYAGNTQYITVNQASPNVIVQNPVKN